MRRAVSVLVAALVILGLAAPQALAQQAAAPAPKVTISGLVDFVTTMFSNLRDNDITSRGDEGWYSRERGVFTITGEIGRSKGVLALELDVTNGFVGGSPPSGVGTTGGAGTPGVTGSLDLDTDVTGIPEVKWLYVETPITGAGSLMPFIPVSSIGRFGGQPARGHDYKPGIHFSGDFPGVTIETTWAPNLRSTITFAQIGEALDRITAASSDDWAILASFEFDVFKGLTVKPTVSYARFDGGNAGTSNLGTEPKGGFSTNTAGGTGLSTSRWTFGGDVRWTSGPFSLQPTLLFQLGEQETIPASAGGKSSVDIRSWILDVIGGFRTGPLTLELRFAWTPGMKARECVQTVSGVCAGGSDIEYYQPINSGFVYQAGWSEIQTSGIDYNLVHHGGGGATGLRLGQSPSYDKYGRITAAAALDYALTPALVFHLVTNWMWTDEKVDTDASLGSSGLTPTGPGDHRFLGHEWNLGFTYRFAPNVAFDLLGGVLVAGDARGLAGKDPENIWKGTARVRVTW